MEKRTVLVVNDESDRCNMSVAGPDDFPGYREDRFSDVELLAEVMGGTDDFNVEVAFHGDVNMDFVRKMNPSLIVGSGRGSAWQYGKIKEEFAGLVKVLHESGIPFLGICGGHQVLGAAFDAEIYHMSDNEGNVVEEKGFTEISVVKRDDPLFAGVDDQFICMESHHDEVRELPMGFEVLVSTDTCRIQAMRHTKLPLYGVQFHPEVHDDSHAVGKRIIQNFVDTYCR